MQVLNKRFYVFILFIILSFSQQGCKKETT
ncbi:MAG: hypothetical protein RL092_1839, partial [Bacteroidota bacterium]